MNTFILKPGQEAFEIVDGPGAGKKFERGREYDEAAIPASVLKARFVKVEVPAKAEAPAEAEIKDEEPAGKRSKS